MTYLYCMQVQHHLHGYSQQYCLEGSQQALPHYQCTEYFQGESVQFLDHSEHSRKFEHLETMHFNKSVAVKSLEYKPFLEKPSCWQATFPSFVLQRLSQIVPQVSLKQISTRPSISVVPPTSLKSPLVHRPTQMMSWCNIMSKDICR